MENELSKVCLLTREDGGSFGRGEEFRKIMN